MSSADFTPRLGSPGSGVVITGGASGIGLATAHALAAVGRAVALWDIDTAGVEAAAKDIAARYGVATLGLTVDLRDAGAIGPAAEASRKAIGPVGGLVHSAGTAGMTGIAGVTPESFDSGMALHVRPILLMVQAFRQDLAGQPGSAIVALASVNATLGNGMVPVYSAAKGAVISLVRSMAEELANDGIRMVSISPGLIDTPISAAAKANAGEAFERRIMLGRFGNPDEVGRVIRFLLSDEASYMTGVEVLVDGGIVNSQRL